MQRISNEEDIRCFCRTHPKLAIVGINNSTRMPFVWMKVYKSSRVYGEVIIEVVPGTVVRLRCRECSRWHTIRVRHADLEVNEEPLPATLSPAPT